MALLILALLRSEERFSRNAETDIVCRLLLEKKKKRKNRTIFSNQIIGRECTWKSIDLYLDSFILIRPSWGTRLSEISICDISFFRAAIFTAVYTLSLHDALPISKK